MTIKNLATWNKRMSALYAVGMWTMICSYGFFRYTSRNEDTPMKQDEVQENPNQVVYETAYTKCVYKEGFVPYTTRIINFVKSLSAEPGSGDSGK